MPAKMTVGIHDGVHHRTAEGIEYDLWRINDQTGRIKIKHDRITSENQNVLVQANTPDDLGSFEIVLFIKDYFENIDQNLNVQDSRMIVPFGMNQIDRDYHLNISITPTSVQCTL